MSEESKQVSEWHSEERSPHGPVQVADLAQVHARLARPHLNPKDRASIDETYRRLYSAFEESHGHVTHIWFADKLEAAAAVTEPRSRGLARFVRGSPRPTLHVTPLFVGGGNVPAGDLLVRCQALSLRAQQALMRPHARIATELVFTIASTVLAGLDARVSQPGDEATLSWSQLASLEKELARAEEYFDKNAVAYAQRTYTVGVLIGAVMIVVGAIAVEVAASRPPFADASAVAIVAGTVGATVSVIQRVGTRSLPILAEVGGVTTGLLGSFRAVIGAVAGAAVYFVLQSRVVVFGQPSSVALYAVTGFLAGFAERFAHDILDLRGNAAYVQAPTARRALEAVERLPTTVEESVRASLRGPELANWRGYVRVSIEGARIVEGSVHVEPHQRLTLNVRFGRRETGESTERLVDLHGGIAADPVTFNVRLDSDTILFPAEEHSVQVPVEGEAPLQISFTAPRKTGQHRAWVHIAQRNRTVQIVPIAFQVLTNE